MLRVLRGGAVFTALYGSQGADLKVCTMRIILIKSAKFRGVLLGNHLRPSVDYFQTFSSTVANDTIKFFFSLACGLQQEVYSADAVCAYLASKKRIPLTIVMPSYYKLARLPIEELMRLRQMVLQVYREGGLKAVRRLNNTMNSNDQILSLNRCVYGGAEAGWKWQATLVEGLTRLKQQRNEEVDLWSTERILDYMCVNMKPHAVRESRLY